MNQKGVKREEYADLEARPGDTLSGNIRPPPLLRDLIHTQTLIKQICTDEARKAWSTTQRRIYQWGDKCSKTLQWLCARRRHEAVLSHICLDSGELAVEDKQKANTFAACYNRLYELNAPPMTHNLPEFFRDLPFKRLSDAQREMLEREVTVEEMGWHCLSCRLVIPLGPIGFWTYLAFCKWEFFRHAWHFVGEHVKRTFDEAMEGGTLPRDLRTADIVVIPKPQLPPEKCESYRPISLLDVEVKIWA